MHMQVTITSGAWVNSLRGIFAPRLRNSVLRAEACRNARWAALGRTVTVTLRLPLKRGPGFRRADCDSSRTSTLAPMNVSAVVADGMIGGTVSLRHLARCTRRRAHRLAAAGRDSRDPRHHSYRDECRDWRTDSGSRNDSRADAAPLHAVRGPDGRVHSIGNACRHPGRGGPTHEPMARIYRGAAITEERRGRAPHDIRLAVLTNRTVAVSARMVLQPTSSAGMCFC